MFCWHCLFYHLQLTRRTVTLQIVTSLTIATPSRSLWTVAEMSVALSVQK